uniref:Uncharacterized protein n=1 Tax=Arundo donax TaxID=35708 RepID=A0A0A8YJW7_ARUDO
MLDPQIFFS